MLARLCTQVNDRRNRELETQLEGLRNRIEKVYLDKLDGRIPEEFWQAKDLEWRIKEQDALRELQACERDQPDPC